MRLAEQIMNKVERVRLGRAYKGHHASAMATTAADVQTVGMDIGYGVSVTVTY